MSNGTTGEKQAVGDGGLTDAQILDFCANAARLVREQAALLDDAGQAEGARQIILGVAEDMQRAISREAVAEASTVSDEPQEQFLSLSAAAAQVCCSTCYPAYQQCLLNGTDANTCWNRYQNCKATCNRGC